MVLPIEEIAGLRQNGSLNIVDGIGTTYFLLNTAKPPFTDPRVRKALSLAVDRNYLVNNVTQTGEKPANGVVALGIYDAQGPGSDFRTQGRQYFDVDTVDANIAEAKRLLAEAGYPNGNGFPITTISYTLWDGSDQDYVEAIQDMWKNNLGITVILDQQEWQTLLDALYAGEYTTAFYSWIADYNDPSNFLDLFTTGNSNNVSQYSNPAFDALLYKTKTETNVDQRIALLHQAEDIIGDETVVIPLNYFVSRYVINPQWKGLYNNAVYFYFADVVKK
jgi:oligopeptide transport system substrate-binding protein